MLIRFDRRSIGGTGTHRRASTTSLNLSQTASPHSSVALKSPQTLQTPVLQCRKGDGLDERLDETDLGLNLSRPLSNGTGFDTNELPYVHYLLNRNPRDRWFAELSQSISVYTILTAMDHPVLRHATISMAAFLASQDPQERPEPESVCIYRSLEHKHMALQLLRRRVATLDIDENVAGAISFLLSSELGGPCTRVHMQGLKSVLRYLYYQTPGDKNDINSVLTQKNYSPMIWISWVKAIKADISQATIDGNPVLDPLPFTADIEFLHRSWISEICTSSLDNHGIGVEWGVANWTLRMLLHQAFHVAGMARTVRASPDYSPSDESGIQYLCSIIENNLDYWIARPFLQQAKIQEQLHSHNISTLPPETKSFLHYPPLIIHHNWFHNLMNDYRTVRLYNSIVANPQVGLAHDSSRFEYAVEICRCVATGRIDTQWNHNLEASRIFQLFLCCLVFGGDDGYSAESQGALDMIVEMVPASWGISVETILYRWIQHCPGIPLVSLRSLFAKI